MRASTQPPPPFHSKGFLHSLTSRNEFMVAVILVLTSVFVGSIAPAFWTIPNLLDVIRTVTVSGIVSMGVLIVVVSGGFDVSFYSISVFAMYVTTMLFTLTPYRGPIIWMIVVATLIGAGLGSVDALLINSFKLNPFMATLGTQNMFRGFLLAFIGNMYIYDIPQCMLSFSRWTVFSMRTETGAIFRLQGASLLFFGSALLTWFIMSKTMLGRKLAAMGGDINSAERIGLNIKRLNLFLYIYAGALAGLAGITHASLMRLANPFELVGRELIVLAGVFLGGARVSGGHGTVLGTLMGVVLVTIINNSLILMGIPTYWQWAVVGCMILVGTGVPSFRAIKRINRSSVMIEEDWRPPSKTATAKGGGA